MVQLASLKPFISEASNKRLRGYKNIPLLHPKRMPIYRKSVFYHNVYDTTNFIILAEQEEKIIEISDTLRGYVEKEELLDLYDYLLEPEDIGEHSYIIEYLLTEPGGVEKVETERIPVK